jgi:hypothetical protein
VKPRWSRDEEQDEHATARPLSEDEREAIPNGSICLARKRTPRPDADGYSLTVDTDEDPPIAALFDSYGDDE